MIQITTEDQELFDEAKLEFIDIPGVNITLEHSLLSLSKWESEFQKPFLGKDTKTDEEVLGYVRAMVVEPLGNPPDLQGLTPAHFNEINDYIQSPATATTFGELPEDRGPGETITSELIYYWMVSFTIPWEAESWHLNRLFALIRICSIKNAKPQKVNQADAARKRAALNAQRRAESGSSG